MERIGRLVGEEVVTQNVLFQVWVHELFGNIGLRGSSLFMFLFTFAEASRGTLFLFGIFALFVELTRVVVAQLNVFYNLGCIAIASRPTHHVRPHTVMLML